VPVCAHRIIVNPRAAMSQRNAELNERVLEDILTQVEVPL